MAAGNASSEGQDTGPFFNLACLIGQTGRPAGKVLLREDRSHTPIILAVRLLFVTESLRAGGPGIEVQIVPNVTIVKPDQGHKQ